MLEDSVDLPGYLVDLLFLPLLGGYWFYQKFHWTTFRANRLAGQRLIFHAAACGLLLLAVTHLLMLAAATFRNPDGPWHSAVLWGVVPASSLALAAATTGLAWSALKQGFIGIIKGERAPVEELETFGVLVPSRFEAIAKVILGGVLILILVIAMLFVVGMDPIPGEGWGAMLVATLALLAGASWWNYRIVNAYMTMPVASFLFRYSASLLVLCLGLLDSGQNLGWLGGLWREFVPLDSSALPFLACLLGLLIWRPLNLFLPYEVAVAQLHEDGETDSLEHLFYVASIEQKLLMVTMNDGKVYVGHIRWLPPNPQKSDAYFQFLPAMSGYRDPVTRRVTFTDFYVIAYDAYLEDITTDDDEQLRPFVKILPVRAVVSANGFEPSVFERFQADRDSQEEDAVGVVPDTAGVSPEPTQDKKAAGVPSASRSL